MVSSPPARLDRSRHPRYRPGDRPEHPSTRHLREIDGYHEMTDERMLRRVAAAYFGLITHLPCAMPRAFFERSSIRPPEIEHQIEVWQQVHSFLNAQPPTLLARIRKA